jgi:hypothetical protein
LKLIASQKIVELSRKTLALATTAGFDFVKQAASKNVESSINCLMAMNDKSAANDSSNF